MRRQVFAELIATLDEDELYEFSLRLLLQENLGYLYNAWKCDYLYEEAMRRNSDFYDKAAENSITQASEIENAYLGLTAYDLKPFNQFTAEELSVLENQITILKRDANPALNTNEESGLADIFGIAASNLFFCKVKGNSMKDAGIHENDFAALDISEDPVDGDIIAAEVGGEAFIKRLRIENGQIWLYSDNDDYSPVRVSPAMHFNVIGIVKFIIHAVEK